jgi:hypothetical protein
MVKAKAPNLSQKAMSVLTRMEEMYQSGNQDIKPTKFTYNAILLACAESFKEGDASNNMTALKNAIQIFKRLRNGKDENGVDHVSFGNMLRVSNLLPTGPQKDALVKSTFQLCCKLGFVNNFTIRDLQLVASDDLYGVLVGLAKDDGEIDLKMLPPSWQRSSFAKPVKKVQSEPHQDRARTSGRRFSPR